LARNAAVSDDRSNTTAYTDIRATGSLHWLWPFSRDFESGAVQWSRFIFFHHFCFSFLFLFGCCYFILKECLI
jgi:hypothetical protein